VTPAKKSGPAKKAPAAKKAAAKKTVATGAAAAMPSPIDPSMLALRPRPAPAPEVLAAITAAAQLVWPRPAAAPQPEVRSGESWRFSGRWWAQPALVRRPRPWTGR
jgi:hypothetical protein